MNQDLQIHFEKPQLEKNCSRLLHTENYKAAGMHIDMRRLPWQREKSPHLSVRLSRLTIMPSSFFMVGMLGVNSAK